ncbi:hypothetical protein JVU11DRAFT_1604 [Chiua virens]|nr:hypothetical protein JVU11DRAFT_1604 [Chiua virens]
MAPRKKCSICGSRQWRKNGVGLVTCSEGHVLQHFINESEEADDVGTHVMRKRTLKSHRRKKEGTSRADPKLYHGDRARFHYYQCLQLLFRKQVTALIGLWNLPPGFETICRDLWAFHLNLIPRPPPAEPFHYTREQEGYQQKPEEVGEGSDPSGPEKEGIDHPLQNAAAAPDENLSASEDEMFVPEIAVLLEENSEVSSTDDGSSGDERRTRNNVHTSNNPFVSRADRPENTIALLVLACWTIRLPVIYMDFINAIESYSLPYLDHIRSLPPSLACHLTKHAVQALSPHHAPKTLSLHRLASRLASRFYDTYDIAIPELNTAPVLWRAVQECFGGTPMLYVLTKTVGNVLSLGLSLRGSLAPSLCSDRRDADTEKYDNAPPEVRLVATAIVVLKLRSRLPRSADDAACAFPALNEFLAAVREADRAERDINSRPHRSFLLHHHPMRRLASLLVASSRRTDRSDAPSSTSQDDDSRPRLPQKKSRVFSLSRKHLSSMDPVSLPPLIATDFANSSSSSSSGSTTLRTPDDDGLPRRPSKKGSWKSWLGGKDATFSDHTEERHTPWQSSQNMPLPPNSSSTEMDSTSLQSDDPYGSDGIPTTLYSPQQMTTARANARTMITNSLVPQHTSAPLFQSPEAISFPRSCHNRRHLRHRETLESELHKKSLLARLDRLSPSAESSIVSLASKSVPPKPQSHWKFQDDVFPSADSVNFHSRGLENWVSRPCFEDRLQLWTCSETDEIVRIRIPGSHFGVAALEFSESLELLAGTLLESDEDVEPDVTFDPTSQFTLPPLTLNLDPPAAQMKEPESGPLTLPSDMSQTKDSPAKPSPSQQTSAASLTLPNTLSPAQQVKEPTSSGSATNDPVPKRGVRFADDDGKDDQIPLGYVLRIRKNKEQKAQFLREERARRARVAQLSTENRHPTTTSQVSRVITRRQPLRPPLRPLISLHEPLKPQKPATVSQVVGEEERLRREVEKIEMEKLKRSRELARKQAEERERAYAEELQAARARREAVRAGRPLLESASLSPRAADRSRSGSRDSMHLSLRGSNVSHKYTPELVFTPVSPHGGSPSSSVPATPGSQYSFSRPPSLYSAHTASSEDVRGRDGRLGSRRMSVLSDTTKGISLHPPYDPRMSFNPYVWTGVPPVPPMPAIPMVNGMPFYGVDMPLLPPTPPFMMNEFGVRSRSYTGSPGQSPLQSSTSLPRQYSSEGANSSSRNSSSHSFGSHQRRSSDDAPRVSRSPGGSRSGSYTDVRGSKTSASMRGAPSQSPQRSSFVVPEPKRSSSLRPVSGAYPSVPPAQVRRRTAAS